MPDFEGQISLEEIQAFLTFAAGTGGRAERHIPFDPIQEGTVALSRMMRRDGCEILHADMNPAELASAYSQMQSAPHSESVLIGAGAFIAQKYLTGNDLCKSREWAVKTLICIAERRQERRPIEGDVVVMPRLYWICGEVESRRRGSHRKEASEEAINLFTQALKTAARPDVNDTQVIMHASLGRAIARIRLARLSDVALEESVAGEIEDDLTEAGMIASGGRHWQIKASVYRELGRLDGCTGMRVPDRAKSHFESALREVERHSPHAEDKARRVAKICRAAIDSFLRNGEMEYLDFFVSKALSIPSSVLGKDGADPLGAFRDVCNLLERITPEFVLGSAIAVYMNGNKDLSVRLLRELDCMVDAGRLEGVKWRALVRLYAAKCGFFTFSGDPEQCLRRWSGAFSVLSDMQGLIYPVDEGPIFISTPLRENRN